MSLKVASVTPMHKKGGSLDCNNYRPVLLISNLSKLIEKLVHNRLYNFLEKHKLLYEHQYGFQKKHSTNHALIDITEKTRSALDQNIFAWGIFIDLQTAFGTVNHDILLHKLDHYEGELEAIKIATEYVRDNISPSNDSLHIFSNCQ